MSRPLLSERLGRMDPERALAVEQGDPSWEDAHGVYLPPASWPGLWRMRHRRDVLTPVEAWARCACPGIQRDVTSGRCVARATGEDRLCTECRRHCFVVVDGAGRMRMIDRWGAATW